ncbi:transmembrane signal receptor [Lithospermum erythrorhizon]|uniref:Transmembrane signal receptor n=1 Tax=Lithospermum erythrorhizon TaxID=34254 RepID=A0AAV3NII8_LITER
MNKEINTLTTNSTWEFLPLPPGKRTISCKWIYKVKLKADGTIERYKASCPYMKRCICNLQKAFKLQQALLYNAQGTIIVTVSVDDIVITGSNSEDITALNAYLDQQFIIKDLGKLHFFLGFEVQSTADSLFMTQIKFTHELLEDSGLQFPTSNSKGYLTPLPSNSKLSHTEGPLLADVEYYRSMVGKLNFLTNTRPDLSFAVQMLSQFMQSPREPHLQALIHLLNYVSNIATQGIILKGSNKLSLEAYSDWTACPHTRRSITGYLVTVGGSPISWKSKKQSTISRSSAEAEYRAMTQTVAEVTWLVRLLADLGVTDLLPVTLHCDNNSALHIARNSVADVLTKILPSAQHEYPLSKLGVSSQPPACAGGGGVDPTSDTWQPS